MASKRSAVSEFKEQVALCKWMDREQLFYFAVPNGSKRTERELEGLRAGVPDLVIILDGGRVLWLEMKRRKGGCLSPAQKVFHGKLEALGHDVFTCHGVKEAVAVLQEMVS